MSRDTYFGCVNIFSFLLLHSKEFNFKSPNPRLLDDLDLLLQQVAQACVNLKAGQRLYRSVETSCHFRPMLWQGKGCRSQVLFVTAPKHQCIMHTFQQVL